MNGFSSGLRRENGFYDFPAVTAGPESLKVGTKGGYCSPEVAEKNFRSKFTISNNFPSKKTEFDDASSLSYRLIDIYILFARSCFFKMPSFRYACECREVAEGITSARLVQLFLVLEKKKKIITLPAPILVTKGRTPRYIPRKSHNRHPSYLLPPLPCTYLCTRNLTSPGNPLHSAYPAA